MKRIILIIIVSIVLTGFCGMKPLKPLTPLGCSDLVALCVCDSNGMNCRWQWTCIN